MVVGAWGSNRRYHDDALCSGGHPGKPGGSMGPIGRRFMEWYHSKPKDIGNTIRHAFENYKDNWFKSAFLTDLDLGQSAGNGSLMRCLPAALAYTDMSVIERVSRMQSKMTHYDERDEMKHV